MQFSLKVNGIADVNKYLSGYSKEVRQGVIKEVARTTANIHRQAFENAPIGAEGSLKRGVNSLAQGFAGEVWSSAAYSKDVEMGQKPGKMPNWYDLQRWVRRKLGIRKKGHLGAVTYVIQQKILKEGTKPNPFFSDAVNKYKDEFYRNIKRLLNRRA